MSSRGGRRIPTPMPLPREGRQWPNRTPPKLVGSDASYKLSPHEIDALNAVKAIAPKMDKNGYFFYVPSTAKKKKISLMQPRPPRVAFADDKFEFRRPGVAERVYQQGCAYGYQVYQNQASVAPTATANGRGDSMTNRGPSPAPRARLYSQLESYQPRYHTIREREYGKYSDSDKKESECRKRRKEKVPGYPQQIIRGDSGGPLVVQGYIQVGIVSHHYNVSFHKHGIAFYTNTSYFYDWIQAESQNLYCGDV